MEFGEKLQQLRKGKGLTQEELATALYVSRTAVSKWESGKGYPGIDSLKEIASFFSVSIDELLTSDKVIIIAESERKAKIKEIIASLFGAVDILAVLCMILPFYPVVSNEFVYSADLLSYTRIKPLSKVYWLFFLCLVMCGIIKLFLAKLKPKKGLGAITTISIITGVIAVVILALGRLSYAAIFAFVHLLVKILLVFKLKDGME